MAVGGASLSVRGEGVESDLKRQKGASSQTSSQLSKKALQTRGVTIVDLPMTVVDKLFELLPVADWGSLLCVSIAFYSRCVLEKQGVSPMCKVNMLENFNEKVRRLVVFEINKRLNNKRLKEMLCFSEDPNNSKYLVKQVKQRSICCEQIILTLYTNPSDCLYEKRESNKKVKLYFSKNQVEGLNNLLKEIKGGGSNGGEVLSMLKVLAAYTRCSKRLNGDSVSQKQPGSAKRAKKKFEASSINDLFKAVSRLGLNNKNVDGLSTVHVIKRYVEETEPAEELVLNGVDKLWSDVINSRAKMARDVRQDNLINVESFFRNVGELLKVGDVCKDFKMVWLVKNMGAWFKDVSRGREINSLPLNYLRPMIKPLCDRLRGAFQVLKKNLQKGLQKQPKGFLLSLGSDEERYMQHNEWMRCVLEMGTMKAVKRKKGVNMELRYTLSGSNVFDWIDHLVNVLSEPLEEEQVDIQSLKRLGDAYKKEWGDFIGLPNDHDWLAQIGSRFHCYATLMWIFKFITRVSQCEGFGLESFRRNMIYPSSQNPINRS